MRLLAFPLLLTACAPRLGDAGDASDDSDAAETDVGETDATGGDDTDPGPSPTSDLVDPACTDGSIRAPMPTTASLAAVKASFGDGTPLAFAQAALDVRWPTGRYLLDGGMDGERAGQGCFYDYTSASDRGSAEGVLGAASTFVHECGHVFDIRASGGLAASYRIDEDHAIDDCPGGSMQTLPARSLLLDDAWAHLRPPCGAEPKAGCDFYADLYLDGDPTDHTFDSGDQGLDMLLEEVVQYVHSLATGYAFEDQLARGVSGSDRDGILTFLWYLERYLHLLRTDAPAKYDAVVGRACWRDAILLTWGSAWAYLDATDGHRALGIDDAALLKLVKDPELVEEIERVRQAEGCE